MKEQHNRESPRAWLRTSLSEGGAFAVIALAAVLSLSLTRAFATDLDPAAINIVKPDQIPWKERPFVPGIREAVLAGDPSKPGIYVILVKWLPGNMSRPHYHANDRFIKVLSGTWRVGTGNKFEPENTVPVPAGSFVTHFAQQVHYDGAKDEEAVLEIVGEGPATSIPLK